MSAQPVDLGASPRVETDLISGGGRFVDGVHFADECHGSVVRSPHPHARIVSIDTSAAIAAPGVLAVLTGDDLRGVVDPLPCMVPLTSFGGSSRAEADRAVLAVDRVRHVGDPVAFVVAETRELAADAAALLDVRYEPLPATLEPGAGPVEQPVWPDAPDNVCFEWRFGDPQRCRQLFAEAAHVVRMDLTIPRVVVNPIEPRAAVGLYDPARDRMTLFANTQGVHFVRTVLARSLGCRPEKLRVVTPDVGGAFGSKIYAYPEHALVLHAACLLGRPVRWTSTRREALQSDTQGRGHTTRACLALDADGRFLALQVEPTVDLGAYLSQLTPLTATGVGAPVQGGAYRFEAVAIAVRGVFTNKVPVDAFRGAGRPEATYVLERLIHHAAAVLGIDPAELRARNLPGTQTADLTTVTGLVVAGGRFLDNQHRCLDIADRRGFPARRVASARRGLLRGFGFANYLEANGGLQVADAVKAGSLPIESAALHFGTDGTLDVVVGTQSSGQDHARPIALQAAAALGLDPDTVAVREGDSSALVTGSGTGGSKSLLTASVAVEQAVTDAVARAREVAAKEWDLEPTDVTFGEGVLSAPGRTVRLTDLAAAFPGALDGQASAPLRYGSSANGCHACEVEIDPETGQVDVVRYVAVDDFGKVVNEAAVRGQVQGGVAQGIGQALLERAPSPHELARDGSLRPYRYVLPRATDVPEVEWHDNGLAFRHNVHGAKACGESGASAAPPTVMNAIADALGDPTASRRVQMPARPAEVWRALRAGRRGEGSAPQP